MWIEISYVMWIFIMFVLFEKRFKGLILNMSGCLFICREFDKIEEWGEEVDLFDRMVWWCCCFGCDLLVGIEESKKDFRKVRNKG